MKFAKVLGAQATSVLPGSLQILFPYKAFKKCIATWAAQCCAAAALEAQAQQLGSGSPGQQQLAACQRELLQMLGIELRRLNQTFMEREEQLVMSWQLLEEEVAGAMQPLLQQQQQQPYNQQLLQDLLQLLVNFHGDAVMLLNWSHVNFSAVVKTLKKFDKRTGSCLRTPLMQQALCQPFCSTEVITRLTHSAEEAVSRLTAHLHSAALASSQTGQTSSIQAEVPPVLHAMDTLPAAGMLVPDHSSALGGGAGPRSAAAGCSSKQAHHHYHHGREHGHEGQQSGQQVACQNYGAAGCSSGPPMHACDEQMAECAVMSSRIQAAIDTWQSLTCGAHTPSTCIPPPG